MGLKSFEYWLNRINSVNEKLSDEASEYISNKIKKLIGEGKPRKQAIAIAYSYAKKKGYKGVDEGAEPTQLEVNKVYNIYDMDNNGNIYKSFAIFLGETDGKLQFQSMNLPKSEPFTIDKAGNWTFTQKHVKHFGKKESLDFDHYLRLVESEVRTCGTEPCARLRFKGTVADLEKLEAALVASGGDYEVGYDNGVLYVTCANADIQGVLATPKADGLESIICINPSGIDESGGAKIDLPEGSKVWTILGPFAGKDRFYGITTSPVRYSAPDYVCDVEFYDMAGKKVKSSDEYAVDYLHRHDGVKMYEGIESERDGLIDEYMLDRIDGSDYGLDPGTPQEKIKFLIDRFHEEYLDAYHLNMYKTPLKVFEAWIRGIPTCFGIDYDNGAIINIAKAWEMIPLNHTDEELDAFVQGWFGFIAERFESLAKRNGMSLSKNESVAAEAYGVHKEQIASKWFPKGSGTAYFRAKEFLGIVYEMDNGWCALMGIDGVNDAAGLKARLDTLQPEEGTSAMLTSFDEAEKEIIGDTITE